MKITLSRRTAVRAISYLAAAFGVAAGIAIQQHAVAVSYTHLAPVFCAGGKFLFFKQVQSRAGKENA